MTWLSFEGKLDNSRTIRVSQGDFDLTWISSTVSRTNLNERSFPNRMVNFEVLETSLTWTFDLFHRVLAVETDPFTWILALQQVHLVSCAHDLIEPYVFVERPEHIFSLALYWDPAVSGPADHLLCGPVPELITDDTPFTLNVDFNMSFTRTISTPQNHTARRGFWSDA